jgi:phage shock protein PspC (stress-responsive transcriptional regulator)
MSGIIFHIEEEAYEYLKDYINKIKIHFVSYQDSAEIITDIENRIAEMFSEFLEKEGKQVITYNDIENVETRMGKPSEFSLDGEEEEQPEFAEGKNRKLYRDIDDKIVAGVCAGISHYFDIEVKWTRITFAFLFIFYGFGLIPYIILWLILPKAKTRTEKMEMKGERINIQTFQKNIEEELSDVKNTFMNASKGMQSGFGKLEINLRDMSNNITKIILNILHVIFKAFGYLLITIIGIWLVLSFIALLVFLGYLGNSEASTIFPLNALNVSLRAPIIISGFILIFIPLLSLGLFTVKIVSKNTLYNKTLSFSLLMVWVLALTTAVYCLAKNSADFKAQATYSENVPLEKTAQNSYTLSSNDEKTLKDNSLNNNVIISLNDNDFETPNDVDFILRITDKESPFLIRSFSARGKNYETAIKTAQEIKYFFKQKDSLLVFDDKSGLSEGSLWRDQEVDLVLNIPINSTIYIETKFAKRFLRNKIYDCYDYMSDDDKKLIEVKATKDGFICNKTAKTIEDEKKRNDENSLTDQIEKTVIF